VRIDGIDVDPAARHRTGYGLKCRVYRADGGQQPLPSDDWIRVAITDAAPAPGSRR
jgi:hypothetical protein